jgi:hypothetical protein
MMATDTLPNGATLVSFDTTADGGRAIARAQNFIVEWVDRPGRRTVAESAHETILLLADGAARIDDGEGEIVVEGPAIAIVPPGRPAITLDAGGPLLLLATDRVDLDREDAARNHQDTRIAPVGTPFRRRRPLARAMVMPFDAIPNPSGNPRIRFIQTATMSINIVRYEGPRDTTSLSPHAHADIEQGTLAIVGRYVHHLRTPWQKDMAGWREDAHVEVDPATLLLIPPELVHTTRGVDDEPHLLVDIFAPPRRDFIARGWIANAGDYDDPFDEGTTT